MSIGTVTLLGALSLALPFALLEPFLLRRFRGPSFGDGFAPRWESLGSDGWPANGASAPGEHGTLARVSENELRFVTHGPAHAVGRLTRQEGEVIRETRLALGLPLVLGLAAALCGHLAGAENPFLTQPVTPPFLAYSASAIFFLLLLALAVRSARRRAERLLEEIPELSRLMS